MWTWQNGWVGSIGSQVKSGRESGQVDSYFSNKFFFFEIDAICQLFLSSLIVIKFSLVILLSLRSEEHTSELQSRP